MLYLDRQTEFASGTHVSGPTYTDSFTDADSTAAAGRIVAGGTWSRWYQGGIGDVPPTIVSNALKYGPTASGASKDTLLWSVPVTGADYSVVADLLFTALNMPGVVARGISGTGGYCAYLDKDSGAVQLITLPASGDPFFGDSIGTFATTLTASTVYSLKLECIGTAIKVYLDGVQVISVTDSTFAAAGSPGTIGEGFTSDYSTVDNLVVAEVVGTGQTKWLLPYAVATDGSEGTVQVVTADGTVLTSTRPDSTHVQVAGDFSTTPVTIGLQYTFTVTLSPIIYRPALRFGDPTATLSGRLQMRWMDFWYGASRYAKVTVTPQGRTAYEYVLSKSTAESDKFHVPLLTKNDVAITITNDKPLPFFLTGATWEGFFHDRSQRG